MEKFDDHSAAIERRTRRAHQVLVAPAMTFVAGFGILPLAIILVYSFLKPGPYAGVTWEFSLSSYTSIIVDRDIFTDTLQLNTALASVYLRSITLALVTTVTTFLIGFPTAYFIATRRGAWKNILLLLVTLPFWTNLLIRVFSILLLIRDEGVINDILVGTGLISSPVSIAYTNTAVLLGLTYAYLPFMILPIYAAVERLDFRIVEAGYDLYASRFQVLTQVVMPATTPGIVAGAILVFIPSLGAYVIPDLLGGGKHQMLGNLIANQFGNARNWPFGSALSIVLVSVVMLVLILHARSSQKRRGRA